MSKTDRTKMGRRNRQLGYQFERDVVKVFNELGFKAKRLGSTVQSVPDLIMTKKDDNVVAFVECKFSRVKTEIIIKAKQINNMTRFLDDLPDSVTKIPMIAVGFGNEMFVFSVHYMYKEYDFKVSILGVVTFNINGKWIPYKESQILYKKLKF